MQVHDTHAYTYPSNTRETSAARGAAKGEQKTTDADAPTRAAVASATGQTADNAVTGTTGSRLSAEVMGQLIAVTQEVETANTLLPEATQNGLNDVANDPRIAEKRAKDLGRGFDLPVWDHVPGSQAGDPPYDVIVKKLKDLKEMTSKVQNERQAIYEKGLAEGVPPAQLVLKLLEFNANLPQSYGDKLDQRANSRPDKWQSDHQAMAGYLRQAIAQANASEATEKLS